MRPSTGNFAAGVFKISLGVLILASVLGRSGRFFLVATCIYFFGPMPSRSGVTGSSCPAFACNINISVRWFATL